MSDVDIRIRCQRCGANMELRDPASAASWTPDQFWVCPACGRHTWTTYPPPKPKTAEPAAATKPAPAPAAAPPAAAPAAPPAAPPAGSS